MPIYWLLQETSDDAYLKAFGVTTADCSRPISHYRFRQRRRLTRLIVCAGLTTLFFIGVAIHYNRSWPKEWLPTNFDVLSEGAGVSVDEWISRMLPDEPIRSFNGSGLDDQYIFSKQLSTGHEGATAIYYDIRREEDVVIKTFTNKYRPLRNFLPTPLLKVFGANIERWPTEVPATLLMGGLEYGSYWSRSSGASGTSGSKPLHDFLPVYDYFVTRKEQERHGQWHLVTPLVHNGTLLQLATRIRTAHINSTNIIISVSALHATFQATFNHVLNMLSTLHSHGLCHDDVKPSNIFVIDDEHWVLADLGAVREIQHPLHRSIHWHHLQQWPDCRQNDIRRAIKVYLSLLRDASTEADGSTRAFDEQFMAGRASWASMYWDYIARLTRHEHGIQTSRSRLFAATRFVGAEPGRWALARWIWTEQQVRAYIVSQELHTSMVDSWGLWMLRDWLLLGSWRKEWPVSVRA